MSIAQIDTVIKNLERTILGKEILLDTYRNPQVQPYPDAVKQGMIQFLEINIAELQRILDELTIARKDLS